MTRDPNDPNEPISAEEAAEAEALRIALEQGDAHDEGASLLRSLKAAHAPTEIDAAVHRALIDNAIAKPSQATARSGKVIRVAFGVSTIVAAAAAVILVLRPATETRGASLPYLARSTQSLIDESLKSGSTTARVDRIAAARAIEFRENQFATWGIR